MQVKKLLLLGIFSAVSLIAGNYNVDVSHSNVGFKVKHLMISNVKGSFSEFSGSFEYDEKTNTLKKLDGVIEVKSIDTANAKRDAHLRSSDFFDLEKYPLITFKLLEVNGDEVYGDFTMKGITKKIKLDYEAGGSNKNPRGMAVAAFSLTGEINRGDFNLSWNKALETGGFVVGDKIKLEIDLEGVEAK